MRHVVDIRRPSSRKEVGCVSAPSGQRPWRRHPDAATVALRLLFNFLVE